MLAVRLVPLHRRRVNTQRILLRSRARLQECVVERLSKSDCMDRVDKVYEPISNVGALLYIHGKINEVEESLEATREHGPDEHELGPVPRDLADHHCHDARLPGELPGPGVGHGNFALLARGLFTIALAARLVGVPRLLSGGGSVQAVGGRRVLCPTDFVALLLEIICRPVTQGASHSVAHAAVVVLTVCRPAAGLFQQRRVGRLGARSHLELAALQDDITSVPIIRVG
mmetsp:Transcript_12395/g.33252  ORF Transcript_12395/g.33252 Transcript_12395/m.33252 type:complete len:229 (+) Transcript_12395:254-940(+)